MPNLTPPAHIYPVAESFWQMGPENAASGTLATAFTTMASGPFAPDDKITPLKNNTLHGSMGTLFGLQQGPIWTEHNVPESPLYGDTIGLILKNFLGDYTATGTAGTPTWTTSGALSPGAGPIAVATGSAASAGTFVQIDTGVNAEVVKVGSGSTTTSITVDATTPIRFSHLSGVAVTTVTGPYTHVFSQLNLNSSTGVTSGQPPTHSILHRTGLPGSGNFYATAYPYACFSEVTIMGKASGYVTWSGKATSWGRTYPSSAVTPAFSGVAPWPAWSSTNTIGGVTANDISEWQCTLTRKVVPKPAANGQQAPYVIARGPVDTKFDLSYDPALDESALNHYYTNDQPSLAWFVSNGLTGLNLISMQVNAALSGFQGAPLTVFEDLYGYKATGEFIQSTSLAGNSGGYSPIQVTLQNQTPTY